MKPGTRNFFVGLVAILALVGLALLLILFGEVDRFVQPRYEVTIIINDAGGLGNGSAVTLNGVPVGVVDRVALKPDVDYPVRVFAKIDEAVQIPQPANASVLVSLLGGRSTLQITADFTNDTGQHYARDGSAEIHGKFITIAEALTERLRDEMKPIFDSFDEFSEFARTYAELGRNLNDMVKPMDGSDPDAPNLRDLMARLTETLTQVADAVALAKEWLGDEQMRVDARQAVAGARELMTRASETMDRFSQIAETLDGRSNDVAQRLVTVSDELSQLLEVVRGLADKTAKGEGTLGMLIANPDLYTSLTDAAVRLEQALREAQLLIQKLREEGVNIKL
jgi:ABC-type transporter Mla subunit MlaD